MRDNIDQVIKGLEELVINARSAVMTLRVLRAMSSDLPATVNHQSLVRGNVAREAEMMPAPLPPIRGESFVQTVLRAATKQKPKAKAKSPRGASSGELHSRVLEILNESATPMKFAAIWPKTGAKEFHVRLALRELIADGKVIGEGATTTRTFQPARRRKAAATVAVAPARPARMHYAGDVIDQALANGASFDRRELLGVARKQHPSIEAADVDAHLQLRIDEGKVDKLITPQGDRFRRSAKGGR